MAIGTAVTSQYPQATFSAESGSSVQVERNGGLGTTGNTIGVEPPNPYPQNYNKNLYVSFTNPVNDLTFATLADDNTGLIAQVNVYQGDLHTTTVDITGDGNPYTPQIVDLSQYPGITRIEVVGVIDAAGLWYDDFKFNSPPKMALTAYRTGDNFGTAVSDSVKQSGDPSQYVILTNNNYDEHPDQSAKDYDDTTAQIGTDHGLAKITLHKLPSDLTTGTIEIATSDPSAVRLFQDDGTELTQTTLDLSSPSGYLAGLTSGDMNVWVEGLQADADLIFKIGYQDSSGTEVSRDTVHMCVADWTFVDKAGDTVTEVPSFDMNNLISDAQGSPVDPEPADEAVFKAQIGGLSLAAVQSMHATSVADPTDGYDDTLSSASGTVESAGWAALYFSNQNEDGTDALLTSEQRAEIQQGLQLNVVHNAAASYQLATSGGDKFTRTVSAKKFSYTAAELRQALITDPGYGDKVAFALSQMDRIGHRFTIEYLIGRHFDGTGDGAYVDSTATSMAQAKEWALDALREWAGHGSGDPIEDETGTGPGPGYFTDIGRRYALQYSADGATALGATLDFLYFFSREASGNPAVDMYRATGDDDEDLAGMYEQIFAGRPNNDMSAAFRQPHDPYRVTSRARNSFHSDYWDFVDPEAPNEDQNHHVAGYFWQGFSYGVSNELLVLALKQTGDYPTTRNPGDYQLGVMAAYFGRWWRQNPGYHGGTLKFLLQNNFQTAMNFFGLTNATLP